MGGHINPFYCLLILVILKYCICLSVMRTVLVVSIIEVIAIIVIIVYDILGTTVVSNDNHVPGSQESYEEPRDDPSGTSTPPTPAVSPSHDPPPPAPPLLQCAMADPSEELLGDSNVFVLHEGIMFLV
jgi:hypothetical protein